MTTVERDRPARLLSAAVQVMPARRRDWGHAMQAELAAIGDRPDRWSFAWGCVRAAAVQFHLLRAAVHLLVVLGTLSVLLAWVATVDYPPLAWILAAVVTVLAAVCWEGRRAGMLGPAGEGATAWLLRGCGYLAAGGIVMAAVAHLRPPTPEAVDKGIGFLVLTTTAAGLLIGPATLFAQRSAATARVLITGAGSGLAATLIWLVVVVAAPPIPATAGLALLLTGAAAAAAVPATSGRSGTTQGSLLAGLLAVATTMALIFVAVLVLANWGPDRLIPAITPHALPANRVSESRIEIVDPYVLLVVLSGIAGAALGAAAILTRRPARRTAT
jgi:hypothetical protein